MGVSVSDLFAKSYVNGALDYCGSGMRVQKYRLRVIGQNLANVSTQMTNLGEPYRKQFVVVSPSKSGVRVVRIGRSQAPFGKVYDGSHTYSKKSYLQTPNFELNDELVNLNYTNLMYEANTTICKSSKQMFQNVLELVK